MDIGIKEIKSRKELKQFIYLPEKIHKNHKNWVHPIYMDEWSYFDAKKNEAFSYCDTVLILAVQGDVPIGRCMGIINYRYNDLRGEKTARFGYLETQKDPNIAKALLSFVEDWARAKGMTKIIGPYGFTDQDPEGFLIQGFEHHATIATYYNYDWMLHFVENLGYSKDVDYFVYKIDVPKELPAVYKKVYERVQKKGQYQILEFRSKKELKPWVIPVFKLMNECYTASNIYGYTPLTEDEMKALAKRYLPVVDPRFVKVVKAGEELAAFVIGIPDMTDGIRKAKGRLFPFGFLKILRASKKSKQLDLLLGAIKEKYRGRGLDVMMGVKMLMTAVEAEFEMLDTHHELESNVRVRAEMERIGGQLYKKYRVYQKKL